MLEYERSASNCALSSSKGVSILLWCSRSNLWGQFLYCSGNCNTEWMNEFLKRLSREFKEDYLILIMDNAVWHKSKTLNIPENIELMFIPPYIPELNPIEQIWKEIREKVFANEVFPTLEHVIDRLCETINNLTNEVVKSICKREWLIG
ncbi:IS630 family transposase [Enterococcus cecorum]|uniref:IS630 family transposase n=2 Tax=Enterococcus cecorum TaxID=44008 RepID=UPI0030C6631D